MYLTAANLIPFLLDHAFVAPERVLAGGVRVFEAGRRNRNFHVLVENDTPLFVKQAGNADLSAIRTLDQEARFYRVLAQPTADATLASLRKWLPRFIGADGHRRVLLTEGVEHGTSLMKWHLQHLTFPTDMAAETGRGLAQFHPQAEALVGAGFPRENLPGKRPWVLDLPTSQPANTSATPPDAVGQLLHQIHQTPGFAAALTQLTESWHTNDLIHGDMKWDNILRVDPGTPTSSSAHTNAPTLKLVDWELLDLGDGRWDIGALLQAHWFHWITSIPFHPGIDPHEAVRHARTPIAELQPSMQALWQAYTDARHPDRPPAETHADLLLTIRYGAARLVQTAFESVAQSPTPPPQAHMMLRVAQNILHAPKTAARELLGLPTPAQS